MLLDIVNDFKKTLTRRKVIFLTISLLVRAIGAYFLFRYTKDNRVRLTAYVLFYALIIFLFRIIE